MARPLPPTAEGGLEPRVAKLPLVCVPVEEFPEDISVYSPKKIFSRGGRACNGP